VTRVLLFCCGRAFRACKARGCPRGTSLQIIPFGNAYVNISACGGGSAEGPWIRDNAHCWLNRCAGDSPPDDCFVGEPVCQHGPDECALNLLEACAVTSAQSQLSATLFVICAETTAERTRDINTVAQQCASGSQLDLSALLKCFHGPDGAAAQMKMAKETAYIGRARPGTPYVTVDGNSVNPSELLQAICEKASPKPPSCTSAAKLGTMAMVPKQAKLCTV